MSKLIKASVNDKKMIRLMIKSKLPENYNQLLPNVEVQRDTTIEVVIKEFCEQIRLKYDPLMYLKCENGECLNTSSKVEYLCRYKKPY